MSRFTTTVVILLLTSAAACSGSNTSPAAPSTPGTAPTPTISTPVPTSTFHVTGIVTEDDGNPVAGATVSILNPSLSRMTDGRGSYSIDFDGSRGAGGGLVGWVKVESAGHDLSYTYLIPVPGSQDISQNLHIYRIRRITAGESTVLTAVPGDTSCGDDDEFTCRTVHIVAPADGVLTIEAVPTPSATNAGLEIRGGGVAYQCCTTIALMAVSAGTEVVANVGMWWTSTASQSFVLNTSLVRR